MGRRAIDAAELLARPPFARPKLGRCATTREQRTAAVLRVLAGENPEHVGLELGRSAATVLAWCSYWRTGKFGHLFVGSTVDLPEPDVEIPHANTPEGAAALARLARRRDSRPVLRVMDGGAGQ